MSTARLNIGDASAHRMPCYCLRMKRLPEQFRVPLATRLAHLPTGAATATGRSIQGDSGKMSGNRNTP